MAVTMTSEAMGKEVGEVFEGPEEAWLLAEGYAEQEDYDGPGVSNTGPTDVDPEDDPTVAENRETYPVDFDDQARPNPAPVPYDFDPGGVNDDPVTVASVEPAEGPAAGGTEVVVTGANLDRVVVVKLDTVDQGEFVVVGDELTFETAAGTAGVVDLVLEGEDDEVLVTETDAFTYTA